MVKGRLHLVSPMKAHMKDETTIEMLAFNTRCARGAGEANPCYPSCRLTTVTRSYLVRHGYQSYYHPSPLLMTDR